MGLDINLFRVNNTINNDKINTLDLLKSSQERRYAKTETVDEVSYLDLIYRQSNYTLEKTKKQVNFIQKALTNRIKDNKKNKIEESKDIENVIILQDFIKKLSTHLNYILEVNCTTLDIKSTPDHQQMPEIYDITQDDISQFKVVELLELKKFLSDISAKLQIQVTSSLKHRDHKLSTIGNIVHESVPLHNNEDFNEVIKTWYSPKVSLLQQYHLQADKSTMPTEVSDIQNLISLNHVDCMKKLGCMDTTERVTKISGGRSYVLTGKLVELQFALIMYSMQYLVSNYNYTPIYPPFFLKQEVMPQVAQLSQFDEELYNVSENTAKCTDNTKPSQKEDSKHNDKYLIATSEQPIAAYHIDQQYNISNMKEELKYAGYSTNFRREVGTHGKDTLGIFRVHQFEKIEQFIICEPNSDISFRILDEMVERSEKFYESLGLGYRSVVIVSGALNNSAAKKVDIECYFPHSNTYRELVSCSNCTDYQARSLNTRYQSNKDVHTSATSPSVLDYGGYVHMLNGTLCAITRTLCCICETYQTSEGILVPEPLKPFMSNKNKDILLFD